MLEYNSTPVCHSSIILPVTGEGVVNHRKEHSNEVAMVALPASNTLVTLPPFYLEILRSLVNL